MMDTDSGETMTMTLRKLNILIASCLLAGTACTGGGDEGSGVDGSKTLNNVTAEEAVDICEYEASRLNAGDSKKLGCYYAGIFQTQTEQACQTLFDACMAEASTEPTDSCADAAAELETLPECASMVSVAEIENCASAASAGISALANSLSCSTPGEEIGEPARPVECAAIDEKCPGIL